LNFIDIQSPTMSDLNKPTLVPLAYIFVLLALVDLLLYSPQELLTSPKPHSPDTGNPDFAIPKDMILFEMLDSSIRIVSIQRFFVIR
jgi:hypothetical protein